MDALDRTLDLVHQALSEFDKPDYRLSNVVRKAIRIARLRNDFENLWWLEEEVVESRERAARERMERELSPHFSAEDFQTVRRQVIGASFSERSIRTIEDGKVVEGDIICDLSVPSIEDRIKSLTEDARQQVPPPGMHTLDLYYAEQRYSKAVVNAVGPPLRCLLSSIAREDSERPTRRRQTSEGAAVQYHCTTL